MSGNTSKCCTDGGEDSLLVWLFCFQAILSIPVVLELKKATWWGAHLNIGEYLLCHLLYTWQMLISCFPPRVKVKDQTHLRYWYTLYSTERLHIWIYKGEFYITRIHLTSTVLFFFCIALLNNTCDGGFKTILCSFKSFSVCFFLNVWSCLSDLSEENWML